MTIDPANLSATAVLTFDDEFNTLNLWNGTSGTWTTKYPFSGASGGTLDGNGEQQWYINSTYAPTSSVTPWTVSNGILTLRRPLRLRRSNRSSTAINTRPA